jgi:hypothetical protein
MGARLLSGVFPLLLASCFSVRPSGRAIDQLPKRDTPGTVTSQMPRDAVVHINFEDPAPLAAINGEGESVTLPASKSAFGRVMRRSADTLWVAVSRTVNLAGNSDDYPARGSRARIAAVPLGDSTPRATVRVVNAHTLRSEALATSALVGSLSLVLLFYLYMIGSGGT